MWLKYDLFPITFFLMLLRGAVIVLFLSTGDIFIKIKIFVIMSSVFFCVHYLYVFVQW